MENKLIIVKQLPIITQQLEKIKVEVAKKIKIVDEIEKKILTLSQEEQEKQKSKIKEIRTSFTNDFKSYEETRTEIKNQILKPYEEMELVYKECVTEQYTKAKERLDKVINNIEDKQKKQLEDRAREYFEEYKTSKNIEFLKFENVGLKIGVSDNPTKLQKQVTTFIDKTEDDLKLIDTQNHKEEILVEYMKDLNVSKAITEVSNRHVALEQVSKKQEELKEVQQKEQEVIQKVESVQAPVEVEEKQYVTFGIEATSSQIKELIKFLEERGIKYE